MLVRTEISMLSQGKVFGLLTVVTIISVMLTHS